MATIKIDSKALKASGQQAGKEFAAGLSAVTGGLVAYLRPVLLALPKGKAVTSMDTFWEGFAESAGKTVNRAKVTKSESLRIARGIDAGAKLDDALPWAKWVKLGPKTENGKGAGGGRKPRPNDGTGDAGTDAGTDASAKKTPLQMVRQQNAVMLAIVAKYKDGLPESVTSKVQELAAILAGLPMDE